MSSKSRKSSLVSNKNSFQLEELVLPATKLKLKKDQLENLNFLFDKKLEEEPTEELHILAKSVCERLLQRLICCVGHIDQKFSSKFLIRPCKSIDSTSFLQYIVRLDKLSTPSLNGDSKCTTDYTIIENDPDFPEGYARIRLSSSSFKDWGAFSNNQGFLRRDKIQAKYVELLALAANNEYPKCISDVDDSLLCASPGKVVDAFTLQQILKWPPSSHIYFAGNDASGRFPDPRDFRLAIVDEPDGIRIRLEFLSPTLSSVSLNVRLLIAIGTELWPNSTSFPARVSLGHPDCLLYNQSAQTGVYLVGYGVQSSAWQLRFPAAEELLIENYSEESTVRRLLKLSAKILKEIYEESSKHQKYPYTYKILNAYIFKTLLLCNLERDFGNPTRVLLNWSPAMLSTQILRILDLLVQSLRNQKLPNYFHPKANLLANPGHLCEEDYLYESKRVTAMIVQFYHLSMCHIPNEDIEKFLLNQEMEMTLLMKWKQFVDGLIPPVFVNNQTSWFLNKRVAGVEYTSRQMEFLTLIVKNVRHIQRMQVVNEGFEEQSEEQSEEQVRDLLYLIKLILKQSKEHFFQTNSKKNSYKRRLEENFQNEVKEVLAQIKESSEDLQDDLDFTKALLKYLWRIQKENKRLLRPILTPYLNILYVSSHVNSWFLESIRKRSDLDEMNSLSIFATLVNEQNINPAVGLVECMQKNWTWAKNFIDVIKIRPVTVVFTPDQCKSVRHLMAVPNNESLDLTTLQMKENKEFETLSRKSYFCTILKNNQFGKFDGNTPWHCSLRDNSPLTLLFQQLHRQGDHRCNGDIIKTLVSMQKMNILNEVATVLPPEDNAQLLELLQKYKIESRKHTIRRRAQTLPSSTKKSKDFQKYTLRDEPVNAPMLKHSRSFK